MSTELSPSRLLDEWRADPAQFAFDVWGARCWSKQRELFRSVAQNRRTVVCAGQKTSKTFSLCVIAYWYPIVYPGGKVFCAAPDWSTVKDVLWAQLLELHQTARIDLGCSISLDPATGIRWGDGRSIIGINGSRPPSKAAGRSGRILYILDEAAVMDRGILDTSETTPSGKIVMVGNPFLSSGVLYDSFTSKGPSWTRIKMSSVEMAAENRDLDGYGTYLYSENLATQEWVDDQKREQGEDSFFFQVRILGNFPKESDATFIGAQDVDPARERWTERPSEDDENEPLHVGVDVARFGDDSSVIVCRRGRWTSEAVAVNGLGNTAVADVVRTEVARWAHANERATIKLDTSTMGGVADALRDPRFDPEFAAAHDVIDVVAARNAGDRLDPKTKLKCELVRDALWSQMREWLRTGGSICGHDRRLRDDLLSPLFFISKLGRLSIEPKKDVKKRLKRSPDRADALALAIYEPPQVSLGSDFKQVQPRGGKRF